MFSHYTSTILRIIPDPRAMVPYPGRYKDMATAAAALPVPPPETRPPRPPGNTPGSGPRKKTSQGTDSPLFPPKKMWRKLDQLSGDLNGFHRFFSTKTNRKWIGTDLTNYEISPSFDFNCPMEFSKQVLKPQSKRGGTKLSKKSSLFGQKTTQ